MTATITADRPSRRASWALWIPGLFVAIGAGVATAHGLYEVALASSVPPAIAWLYPLITDGLALVAYVSTARLTDGGRAYAWAVVVLSAGLSGVAQASYLADGVGSAPPELRFGVGAWPAIAAAIVAHLLFLLGSHGRATVQPDEQPASEPVQATPDVEQTVELNAAVQPSVQPSTEQRRALPASTPAGVAVQRNEQPTQPDEARDARVSPARDRARAAARRHASLHGSLPTTSQLMDLADVARGTAGNALKELREQPTQLHVVNESTDLASDQ